MKARRATREEFPMAARAARSLAFTVALVFTSLLASPSAHAVVTCGSTCYTAADVAAETANYNSGVSGAKCLFIESTTIYQPPTSTIFNGMHEGLHQCGHDVTGQLPSSHTRSPARYLTPYICAPLCSSSGPSACTDSDRDGYAKESSSSSCNGLCNGASCLGYSDCNDNNAAIHPGATEVCNGMDDNCNGQVDEGLQLATCGVGACSRTGTSCLASSCTPGTPTTETCNGIDDNCDGLIDNNIPPQTATCGIGACTRNVSQTCTAGTWEPTCTPGTPAPAEICGNGIDDNCNGQVDEGCACTPGTTEQCGSSLGVCQPGTQTCQANGQWGSCSGGVQPSPEICNGLDDNCNGQVDEGWPNATCGIGACARTATSCLASSCTPGTPTTETCNGIDDNCNGQVDEGCAPSNSTNATNATVTNQTCSAGSAQGCSIGVCLGQQACANGTWGVCVATSGMQPETCNGLDDDCNGIVDDNITPQVVTCGVGACSNTVTQTCVNGTFTPTCVPKPPKTEVCNNIDDDCNGVVDNSLKRACGSNIGVCQQGVQTCAAGAWGRCAGELVPTNETCDGLDNNCNGQVDEGDVCLRNDTPPCVESWNCGEWAICLSLQNETTRSCIDTNKCGTHLSEPVTGRSCTLTDLARAFSEHKEPVRTANERTVILVTGVSLAAILLAVGYAVVFSRRRKPASGQEGEPPDNGGQ